MDEEKKVVTYRRAKTWHIALAQMTGIMQMAFYVLLSYAAYIGNLGFAIGTVLVGVLITVSRVFDGITDPIIAWMIEKFHWKHGKLRLFLAIGWFLMALSTTLMCNVFAGNFEFVGINKDETNGLGVFAFIAIYFLYIIGYTFASCTGNMTGNIMTNDPKQRPTLGVWSTVYAYLSPMIVSMVIVVVLLPKFGIATIVESTGATDYAYTIDVFKYANLIVCGLSFVALVLSCIGLTPYDTMENFKGNNKTQSFSMKDMVSLLKDNKELRRFIVAASSDKLMQTIGSQSVISTLLFSIILGSMVGSSIVSVIAMLPSIIFAVIGARLAGKKGNMKIMVQFTWICIFLNIIFALFILFVPEGSASTIGLPLILFFILMLANNALKMVVSVSTGAFRMDIVDYELYRSGNYLPATVSAVYSFIDKLISALAPMIATALIATIGYYGSKIPMAGDPCTIQVRILTACLYCVLPIVGWICTILAMKKCTLTKERMEEIQLQIAETKAKQSEEKES